MYKMKEVCSLTGLTEKTVRYYVDQELIHPQVEAGLHYRSYRFSEEDVRVLKQVSALRNTEFSIAEIRQMLADSSVIPILIAEKEAALVEKIAVLRETAAPSLEPITALPCLSYLDLACWQVYPPLEPLSRSTLAYLDLSTLPETPDAFIPDPQSIYRIPGLTALSLSYLPGADAFFCQELLAQCEKLLYLDIYGTPAATQADSLSRSRLTAFVYE